MGKSYDTNTFPDDQATHTLTIKVSRSFHMKVLAAVEDGEAVSMADFYRTAVAEKLDKIERENQ